MLHDALSPSAAQYTLLYFTTFESLTALSNQSRHILFHIVLRELLLCRTAV